jgi:enterochelin esterase-like enzyme
VIIALPGGIGYPDNYWFGPDLKLQEDFYKWSEEGKALPFILVMPVLNPDNQYHDCSDIPGSQKMDTWLTQDVPELVKENFRTLRTRDGWGIMGSSSGGFCGLKSVLKYPNTFKVAIPSGPDIIPDSPLWHNNRQAMLADDPEWLAKRLIERGGPDVYFGFQVGTTETSVMVKVKRFIAQYGHGPVHTRLQVITGGEHNARSYTRGMDDGTIQWISQYMQGPSV